MDSDNFVAGCSPAVGCYDGWVAVVDGVVYGPFFSQAEAERAYRALRGEPEPVAGAPAPSFPPVTLDCSHGQGAPVNGGCWCCIDGQWATDPMYCRDPGWAARCGNAGGGGTGGTVPQPSAPVSPGSAPSMPPGAVIAPAVGATAAAGLGFADVAAALNLRPAELALLGLAVGLVLIAR